MHIHFLQQWFGLSDPAMEEALDDVPLSREFAVDGAMSHLPDETTILRFGYLLETHGIAAQILAVANEILSEKGLMLKTGSRDPEMQSTQIQFGYVKTRYRELARNTARITTLFALGNLWMMRKALHKA